jgi:predicted RNA-binding Zn-ribbon protein involved in translation (DUF1610 family)
VDILSPPRGSGKPFPITSTKQLDLFPEITANSTSVVGLVVHVPDFPCPDCGSTNIILGSSRGPHAAAKQCEGCGRHRGWMRAEVRRFIDRCIDVGGRPVEPIQFRIGG